MIQRNDKCTDQLSAKLIFEDDSGYDITLNVFGNLLSQIAMVKTPTEVTPDALLTAPPIRMVAYNDKNIVTAISRETLRESSV